MENEYVGKSVPRVEGLEKVAGEILKPKPPAYASPVRRFLKKAWENA